MRYNIYKKGGFSHGKTCLDGGAHDTSACKAASSRAFALGTQGRFRKSPASLRLKGTGWCCDAGGKSDAPDGFDVHFAPNPDILKTLAADRRPEQKVVGFAAESQNLEDSVRGKLVSKKADMVVGNLLQDGFGTPDNTVFVADASGREERWAHLSKTDVAWRLLSWLLSR